MLLLLAETIADGLLATIHDEQLNVLLGIRSLNQLTA
jgi:hypothetical protein